MRLKFTISYDGSAFYGSQQQTNEPHLKTVVGEFNAIFKELNILEKAVFSSRTDRGVHSTGQVFHIDIPYYWRNQVENLKSVIEQKVSSSIAIKRVEKVDKGFHSRYSAKERVYHYLISKNRLNPFQSNYVTYNRDFNLDKVRSVLKLFEGTHNFRGFAKSKGGTETYTRDMKTVSISYRKGLYILKFRADGFVRSQIRLIVGSLIDLSKGSLTENQIREQIDGKAIHTRKVAPPFGLYLTKVKY